jgi:hypothetical protein
MYGLFAHFSWKGTMENHSTVTPGSYSLVTYDSSGNPNGSSGGSRTKVLDSVTGYSLVQGNKKSPTSFSYTTVARTAYLGSDTTYSNGRLASIETGVLSGSSFLQRALPNFEDMRSYHYNKALADVNDAVRGQLDLSVDIAEWKQTRDLVSKIDSVEGQFDQLARLLGAYTSRDLTKRQLFEVIAKRNAKALGGVWLAWQYGIRPLLGSIHDTVGNLVNNKLPEILQVSKASKSTVSSIKLSQLYIGDPTQVVPVTGINGARISLRFREPNNAWDTARYTSLNPVSIAWELTTLSFIADWFYDIGGMLRSLETSLLYGSRFVDGYSTTLRALQGIHVYNDRLSISSSNTFIKRDAYSEAKQVQFSRVRLGSYPGPRLPTFKVNLGSERLISAASLLTAILSGDGGKRQFK